jgi:hypothetical protein
MLAAAVVPLGSVAAAVVAVVAVLLVLLREVAEGRAHPAHKLLLPLVLPQVAAVLARVPPEPVLLHLLPLRLPQVVVESEVTLHLKGRQSFSAAMAKSSPLTVQPTYERAPSTRSPPKGRPCPSACLNWMPVRG